MTFVDLAFGKSLTRDAGRMAVVFLRGGYDGLSAFIPHSDSHYYEARPKIAVPPPDGTPGGAVRLDDVFALHPALGSLLPLWQEQSLAIVPAAGLAEVNRSHFEAQFLWEVGEARSSRNATGWLNRLASAEADRGDTIAVAVGESRPLVLRGSSGIRLVPSGNGASQPIALDDPGQVLRAYESDPTLHAALKQGLASRAATRAMLQADAAQAPPLPGRSAQDARNLATLFRRDPLHRIGFMSMDGWDTHANQGAVQGPLANRFSELARVVLTLRQELRNPHDVVVVASEFGRTVAENGSRGTDHGFGSPLLVISDAVRGGQWHGRWGGVAPAELHERREIPAHHDYRNVLGMLLQHVVGVPRENLQHIFPGASGEDLHMATLLR